MDTIYRSALNRDVKLAAAGEFRPVKVGPVRVWPPVVLAPMAGVTNYPFRSVCKQFGAGLYVSEMINARPLVDGRGKTLKLVVLFRRSPAKAEVPRFHSNRISCGISFGRR